MRLLAFHELDFVHVDAFSPQQLLDSFRVALLDIYLFNGTTTESICTNAGQTVRD